jgi:hypothetical protein
MGRSAGLAEVQKAVQQLMRSVPTLPQGALFVTIGNREKTKEVAFNVHNYTFAIKEIFSRAAKNFSCKSQINFGKSYL